MESHYYQQIHELVRYSQENLDHRSLQQVQSHSEPDAVDSRWRKKKPIIGGGGNLWTIEKEISFYR